MLIAEPVVHYVRNSSGTAGYPQDCRNAMVTAAERFHDICLGLAVFDPEGVRFKRLVEHDISTHPAGGTWHHISECPHLAVR